MKKISILLLILGCLVGCQKKEAPPILIEGHFNGLGTDTLLLYGFDHQYDRVDSLPVHKDHIHWELQSDTLLITILATEHTTYPIFLQKRCHLSIEADTAQPKHIRVTGNKYNNQMSAFNDSIENKSEKEKRQLAERFIRQNKTSIVSVYLLHEYFINQPQPNYDLIENLIEQLDGILQDMPSIRDVQEVIKRGERSQTNKIVPYFNLEDEKGKHIIRSNDFKDKIILIHFWNSTIDSCNQVNMALKKLQRKYRSKKNVAFLNISVDMDKERWKKRIKEDTLTWVQTCEPNGWHSKVIKDFNVNNLPSLMLISSEGRIIKRDFPTDSIQSLLTQALKKEKLKNKKKH